MTLTPVATAPALRDRRARLAVSVVFGLHGVAAGSWAGRIPWVKEVRHLSSAGLGLALMGAAVGGLTSAPLAAGIAMAVSLPLVAFAPGAWPRSSARWCCSGVPAGCSTSR